MKAYLLCGIASFLLVTCGAPVAETSLALTDTLTDGRLSVSVDSLVGGRIASFKVDDREILKTTRDPANLQWGSTVWLSPQSTWGWPPHATFDSEPYTLFRPGEKELLLTSAIDSATQLQLTKHLALRDRRLHLTFTLHNRGDTVRTYGLWSNTRLPYAGTLSFTPGDSVRVENIIDPVERQSADALIHFDEHHPKNGKVFSDLRDPKTVYTRDGLSFVQQTMQLRYTDVAPGQAPLEIYLAPKDGFAEFELQGPYGPIAPGDSLRFKLIWEALTY